MISSKIVLQFGLAIHIVALLISSSLQMPIQSTTLPISPDSSNESNATEIQSSPESITTESSTPTCETASTNGTCRSQNCSCVIRNPDSCTSLQDIIFEVYSQLSLDQDTPYHFFTIKDLYYSALLNSSGVGLLQGPPLEGVDFDSGHERDLTKDHCDNLMARFPLPTKDTNECSWSYSCSQNQLHFPSFHIKAVLDEGSRAHRCDPVRMAENRRFLRTQCRHDASKANWLECSCEHAVVGFEYNLS